MPSAALSIRVMTLEKAIADVSRNPRDFIVLNRECHPREIPCPDKSLLERLQKAGVVDLVIAPTTLAEMSAAYIPIGRHHRSFLAGESVVIAVMKVHEAPERGVGGQEVEGLEQRARDGLYVTVAMATERLRACDDHSEGHRMSPETRRGEIFERLQPSFAHISVRNCFAEGQKRIETWHPGLTSYQAMKSAYVDVQARLRNDEKPVFVRAEQLELVRSAYAVYAKTEEFLKARHAMSAELRKMMESNEFVKATREEQHQMQAKFLREQAPAQHQELAHNKQGGPSLAQLMGAAAAMDLNPSSVFANFRFYKTELDCAMYLGRIARGVGAMFEPKHIVALNRFIAQADEVKGRALDNPELDAARRLRDLALHVKTRAGWDEFFAIAEPDGREFWVSKPL